MPANSGHLRAWTLSAYRKIEAKRSDSPPVSVAQIRRQFLRVRHIGEGNPESANWGRPAALTKGSSLTAVPGVGSMCNLASSAAQRE
jgi:hypothetical protein